MRDFYKPLCDHDHSNQTLSMVAAKQDLDSGLSGLVVQGFFEDTFKTLLNAIGIIIFQNPDKKPIEILKSEEGKSLIATTSKALMQGITTEFGKSNPDLVEAIKSNIFVFSGFKTYQMLKDVSLSLLDDKGKIVSFAKFKEAVKAINTTYNVNWLESEYITANLSARQAAKWEKYARQADKYDLEYDAVDDSHTSDLCKRLNGVVKPASDAFWDSYYPPNHWRCRSIVRQVKKGTQGKELPADTPKPQNMFDNNVGKKGIIFPDNHPYFEGLTPEEKASVMGSIEKAREVYNSKTLLQNENFTKAKDRVKEKELDKVFPQLSEMEATALHYYTSGGFSELNKMLRGKIETDDFLTTYAETLQNALSKLPNFKGTVFRNTPLREQTIEEYRKAFEEKQPYKHSFFTSTSKNEAALADLYSSGNVNFEIVSKTGKYINPISYFGEKFTDEVDSEYEVLFLKDTNFEVIDFIKNGRNFTIKLKEL